MRTPEEQTDRDGGTEGWEVRGVCLGDGWPGEELRWGWGSVRDKLKTRPPGGIPT